MHTCTIWHDEFNISKYYLAAKNSGSNKTTIIKFFWNRVLESFNYLYMCWWFFFCFFLSHHSLTLSISISLALFIFLPLILWHILHGIDINPFKVNVKCKCPLAVAATLTIVTHGWRIATNIWRKKDISSISQFINVFQMNRSKTTTIILFCLQFKSLQSYNCELLQYVRQFANRNEKNAMCWFWYVCI